VLSTVTSITLSVPSNHSGKRHWLSMVPYTAMGGTLMYVPAAIAGALLRFTCGWRRAFGAIDVFWQTGKLTTTRGYPARRYALSRNGLR
jgi:hypothetical protein